MEIGEPENLLNYKRYQAIIFTLTIQSNPIVSELYIGETWVVGYRREKNRSQKSFYTIQPMN